MINESMKNITIFLFLSFFWVSTFAQNTDINLLKEFNLNRNTQLDGTFRGITHSAAPITFGFPVLLLGIELLKKDAAIKGNALCMVTSVVSSALITTVLKHSFNRDRPFITYPFIQNITGSDSPSFPSGHTTDAFAFATSISIAYPK
jgi:membrane-associated phospholipid phosphatase